MKILFAGTPATAARSLRELVRAGQDVVAVLTRQDAEIGRKRVLTPSPVAQEALTLGLPIIKANRVDADVLSEISKYGADIGVVVAYGSLLDAKALAALPKGWVNLHFSLLPDWRGAAPVQRAIEAGDHETGVTLFQLDEGMDTGAIWGKVETQIDRRENSGDLLNRLTAIGATLLNEQLPRIESGLFSASAQIGAGRLAKKISREEARLDFARSAIELDNAIRAFNPEPIAYAMLEGEPFRVLDAVALGSTDWSTLETEPAASVGSLRFEDKRVLVHCGGGTLLELKVVQPAGKKPMTALEWSRGSKATRLE